MRFSLKVAVAGVATLFALNCAYAPFQAFAEEAGVTGDVDTTLEMSVQVDPEGDEASGGALANSFRFKDGVLISSDAESPADDSGISLLSLDARSVPNTWQKQDDDYVVVSGLNQGMRVSGAKGFGIDVSHHQGVIDWAKVKSSGLVDYVIIRCGWGSDYSSQDDRQFINNVRGCQQNGIPFGIYLYSYAYNTSMAVSEANHVLRMLSAAGLTPSQVSYPIYYDLENEAKIGRPAGEEDGVVVPVSNSTLEVMAETFCSTIENAGYRSGVYANRNWWNNYLTGSSFSQWSKWVAEYDDSCSYGGNYDMWQCMSDGTLPGISTNVDINFDFTGLKDATPSGSGTTNLSPMMRLYNPNSGEHLYSSSINERNTLTQLGWVYEGISWYNPASSSTPVYRLYNPNNGDHHYTISVNERDTLDMIGWNYEGICWYADDSQSSPVYRLFNPNQLNEGAHLFTTSTNERDTLARIGWIYEGIAWYSL